MYSFLLTYEIKDNKLNNTAAVPKKLFPLRQQKKLVTFVSRTEHKVSIESPLVAPLGFCHALGNYWSGRFLSNRPSFLIMPVSACRHSDYSPTNYPQIRKHVRTSNSIVKPFKNGKDKYFKSNVLLVLKYTHFFCTVCIRQIIK